MSVGLILWEPQMCVQNFIAIHRRVVEIFHSEPRCCTNMLLTWLKWSYFKRLLCHFRKQCCTNTLYSVISNEIKPNTCKITTVNWTEFSVIYFIPFIKKSQAEMKLKKMFWFGGVTQREDVFSGLIRYLWGIGNIQRGKGVWWVIWTQAVMDHAMF